jgi:hypothetical protein
MDTKTKQSAMEAIAAAITEAMPDKKITPTLLSKFGVGFITAKDFISGYIKPRKRSADVTSSPSAKKQKS